MKTKYTLPFLYLFILTLIVYSQNSASWDPSVELGDAQTVKAFKRPQSLRTVHDLSTFMTSTYTSIKSTVPKSSLNIYREALAHIEITRDLMDKKPGSKEAMLSFAACSLMTEAAILQMIEKHNENRATILRDSIAQILMALNKVHEDINTVERSTASKLAADLSAEKIKAAQLKQEAEKKFAQLRSSLIQVTNDARGTIISMSDILFQSGKADLTSDLEKSLAKIAGILLVFKNSKVTIEGHTDNQGTPEYNMGLSQQRANNVLNFLIEQGIESKRLTAKGYGLMQPVADNGTKEGRQKNRRVDLIVKEIN